MCNCSTNSCDCNDYKVSTGPQGATGPQGPQGPAGPPGNRTYLVSNNYITNIPVTTPTGSYENLSGTYSLTGSTLSNAGDSIIIRAVYRLQNVANPQTRNLRVSFGGVNYTKNLPQNAANSQQGIQVVTLKVSRIDANNQLIIADVKYENGTGFNSRVLATENLASAINIAAWAAVPTTLPDGITSTPALNNVQLIEFSIEKIKNDN
jgi:hypothetical protein